MEEVGTSYNGSISFAPAPDAKSSPQGMMAGSGSVEDRVDRGADLGDAVIECRHGL
jgi:hypothetical protein